MKLALCLMVAIVGCKAGVVGEKAKPAPDRQPLCPMYSSCHMDGSVINGMEVQNNFIPRSPAPKAVRKVAKSKMEYDCGGGWIQGMPCNLVMVSLPSTKPDHETSQPPDLASPCASRFATRP